MSNVIAAKAYQPKYLNLSSSWENLDVNITHLDEIEDETFSELCDPKFKLSRRASIVLIDGIRLLNENGIKFIGLNKNSVWVDFRTDVVRTINSQVKPILQIQHSLYHQTWINWQESGDGSGLVSGNYYTTSPSRGETTKGQGAVDILTASTLFGEALRNLLFDDEKNLISILVLKRFIGFRRFFLKNKSRLKSNSLSAIENDFFREQIIGLSDALYMSGAYYKTDNSFDKRHISTDMMPNVQTKIVLDEEIKSEIFEPDYLEDLVKAYQ